MVKVNSIQKDCIEIVDDEGGEVFTIIKSCWRDRYLIINQYAGLTYLPSVQCLTKDQIVRTFHGLVLPFDTLEPKCDIKQDEMLNEAMRDMQQIKEAFPPDYSDDDF